MNKRINDDLFETVLKHAIYEAEKKEFDEMPNDDYLNEQYPISKKERKEFIRQQKAEKYGVSYQTMIARRIAIIVLTVIIISFSCLMLNSETRASISQIVVQQFQKFTLFKHNSNKYTTSFLDVNDVNVGYIPDNYMLEWKMEDESLRNYYYKNANNDLLLSIYTSDNTDTWIDNEHEYEILYINQRETHISYFEEEQKGTIVIPGEKITVAITGNIEKKELIKVAENIY